MSRTLARARLGLVAAGAFFGGLIVAAGVNLTPFGYAQQQATAPKPSAQEVKPLADASQAFTSIADHVTPAVVSIQTERRATTRANPRQRGQVPPGLEDFFDQFDPRRQQQQPSRGSGSGFIVSADGYVLTNNHVVADADRVNVTLMDKRVFKARVVGRDPSTDVAVLKIEGGKFPSVTFGNDLNTRVGEWVLAIGNPLGLDFTVTAGIVSAKGRSGELRGLYESSYAIVDYIQTDAAINPGNSGGPLVNIRGEVIGINSAIASQTGFYAGYGFAIPITLAKSVMEDLIAHGRVRRAVLGIAINEVTPEDAEAAGLKEIRGARVDGFTGEPSPAERAGLEVGDVIVAINGQPVERVASLQRIVRGFEPGQRVHGRSHAVRRAQDGHRAAHGSAGGDAGSCARERRCRERFGIERQARNLGGADPGGARSSGKSGRRRARPAGAGSGPRRSGQPAAVRPHRRDRRGAAPCPTPCGEDGR